jgi:integrase
MPYLRRPIRHHLAPTSTPTSTIRRAAIFSAGPAEVPPVPLTPGHLAGQIKRTLRQETGIDLNAHAYRHLAAKLFLAAHPGEYETTRLLLGHKDLTTTTQYYCGLEQADALRRYDALIDSYRGKGPE